MSRGCKPRRKELPVLTAGTSRTPPERASKFLKEFLIIFIRNKFKTVSKKTSLESGFKIESEHFQYDNLGYSGFCKFLKIIELLIVKLNYYLIPILLTLMSCTGTGNKNNTDDTTDAYITDSIIGLPPMQTDSLANKEDSIEKAKRPKINFASVEELKEYMETSADASKYNSGIIPLIAEHSFDYASRLLNNEYSGFIIVDKSRMKVILFDRYGREKLTYGMACARRYGTKHKKADSRTPEGFFSAEGIYDSTDWLYTDDNGRTSKVKGQFGPRFIRLRCPNTSQIGIHGTSAPWSIGNRASHGCIRLTNENILELVKHVEVGMPIIVVPGVKDMAVNETEGYETTWIPSTLNAKKPNPEKILKEEREKEEREKEKNDSVAKDSMNNSLPSEPVIISGDEQKNETPSEPEPAVEPENTENE